jgi:putative NIF3 family GTP cyclohydrolase 1 type 2
LLVPFGETKYFIVLLEAPYRPKHLKNSVLLTVDLTKAVADEAITRGDSVIIAYRMFSSIETLVDQFLKN